MYSTYGCQRSEPQLHYYIIKNQAVFLKNEKISCWCFFGGSQAGFFFFVTTRPIAFDLTVFFLLETVFKALALRARFCWSEVDAACVSGRRGFVTNSGISEFFVWPFFVGMNSGPVISSALKLTVTMLNGFGTARTTPG